MAATDIYVFSRDTGFTAGEADFARRDFVENLQEAVDSEKGLRYVANLSGPFGAFAVFQVDSDEVEKQNAQINGIRAAFLQAGGRNIELASPLDWLKWLIRWKRAEYTRSAFARIRTTPGAARAVLEQLNDLDTVNGSAIVAGAFDVLAEVNGDDFRSLSRELLRISRLSGVASTQSSFVVKEWYRGPMGAMPPPP